MRSSIGVLQQDDRDTRENKCKGMLHRVEFMGNQDFVFEVTVREKGGVGIGSSMVTMEC